MRDFRLLFENVHPDVFDVVVDALRAEGLALTWPIRADGAPGGDIYYVGPVRSETDRACRHFYDATVRAHMAQVARELDAEILDAEIMGLTDENAEFIPSLAPARPSAR